MTTFPCFSNQNQNGSNHPKGNLVYNPLTSINSYTNASTINASQYYTYYRPIKPYTKDDNRQQIDLDQKKKIEVNNSYEANKRSSSVYTYPYNYSNEYMMHQQSENEKKKKQKYSHDLKKQIEEKQRQKALEYQRQQEEKAYEEEGYRSSHPHMLNMPNQSLTNYYLYSNNHNNEGNSVNKMSLNGKSIIRASNVRNVSNGLNQDNNSRLVYDYNNNTNFNQHASLQGYSNTFNPNKIGGSLMSYRRRNNDYYALDRTPKLEPLLYPNDNWGNELIFSNCDYNNNDGYKTLMDLPASLSNIDLKAVKYHSKYENYDTEDKSEGHLNDVVCNDNIVAIEQIDKKDKDKGYYYNNGLNNNLKADLRSSLKGNSTLVQADDSKGIHIGDGFLKAWVKEKEKDSTIKKESSVIHNNKPNPVTTNKNYYDKALSITYSNNHPKVSDSKPQQPTPLLIQTENLYKESKSYYTPQDPSKDTKLISKRNSPVILNDYNAEKEKKKIYKKALDYQENIPLPFIEPTDELFKTNRISHINNNKNTPITSAKTDKYLSELLKDIYSSPYTNKNNQLEIGYDCKLPQNSVSDNKRDDKADGDHRRGDNATTNKEYKYSIDKDDDTNIYLQLINKGKKQTDDSSLNKKKSSIQESPDIDPKESGRSLHEQVFTKRNKDTQQDNGEDELCNIRYDNESDNETNNFLTKGSKGGNGNNDEDNEEGDKNEQIEITCNFLDDDEDHCSNKESSSLNQTNKPLNTNSNNHHIEEVKDSKNATGKFQSQINFFNQIENDSFAIKKSKNHKVNPEIISFGNSNQNNNPNNSSLNDNANNTFITTMKEVNSKMEPELLPSKDNNQQKRIEDSIDIRDSFTDKVIKDIGYYQSKH